VVDLFISICLGRPPALYDLDCTVPYKEPQVNVLQETDVLDDTLQILLIVESIVEEVYSHRPKISLQLTRQISQRLKDWAAQRMSRLTALLTVESSNTDITNAVGACQALATYFYAVMLLSRPFLMYEAYHAFLPARSTHSDEGRRILADGCVDAACCLVDMVHNLTQSKSMPQKMPLIVYVKMTVK
jgi:hypothetical protein